MKKVIKLTESDLHRIVKRVIREFEDPDFFRDAEKNWDRIHGKDEDYEEEDLSSKQVDTEQRLEDLFNDAYDVMEENGIPREKSNKFSEEEMIKTVSKFDQHLANQIQELLGQI